MKSLLITVAELIVKMTILKDLQKSSFAATGFGSILSGIFQGFQSGGSVAAGMPYVVGEAGPELFVPHTGGTIVPHGSFGGQIVYNIDARGADASVEQRILRVLPIVKDRAVQRAVPTSQELSLRR
jgi:hypothetical protein